MKNELRVRNVSPSDLRALVEIYNHYVRTSYATFDEQPCDLETRRAWFESYREAGRYRLLVADSGGAVLGYASSSRYREHPAFDQTIETSVYVAPAAVGQGVGKALYSALFAALRGEPLHRAVAGIASPNVPSVALHRRFGFREIGVFNEYAIKNGRRISSVWMEKALDVDGAAAPRSP